MKKKFTVIEDYTKRIVEWLRRAEVELTYDEEANRLYITSMNMDAPLTNSEKFNISKYLVMRHHAFRQVSFRERED